MHLPELSPTEWGAVAMVAVGVAVAAWAGPDLAIAALGAVVAVLGAVLLGVTGLAERRRKVAPRLESFDSHRLVGLRGALRSGELGRSELLATLRGLHRELLGRDLPTMSLQEESRLLDSSPKAFRAWVEAQVEMLERGS